jgi:hypothetical protein
MSLNPLWRALRRAIKPSLDDLKDWISQLPPALLEQLLLWLAAEIAEQRISKQ